jgi:hypothetical protein
MQLIDPNEKPREIRSVRNFAIALSKYNEQYDMLEYEDMLNILMDFMKDALKQGYTLNLPGVARFTHDQTRGGFVYTSGEPKFYSSQPTIRVRMSNKFLYEYKNFKKHN